MSTPIALFYLRGKNQAAKDIAGRFPTSHHWDAEEMKLLVCETKLKPTTETKPAAQTQNWNYGLTKPVIEEIVSWIDCLAILVFFFS